MRQRQPYRRGHPIAVLVGFEEDRAVVWKVFANVIKHEKTVWLDGTWKDQKSLYNFFESTINALRPSMKEGIRSIILTEHPSTSHTGVFNEHVRAHHAWLTLGPNKATFSETKGSAATTSQVAILARNPLFKRLIKETADTETEELIDLLERRLNAPDQDSIVLYSLREIEDVILGDRNLGAVEPEYLILTDDYLSNRKEKQRINRLIQIAANKKIRTRVVESETASGRRIEQLGGMVLITRIRNDNRTRRA